MVRLYYSASILAGRASDPFVVPPYSKLYKLYIYKLIFKNLFNIFNSSKVILGKS